MCCVIELHKNVIQDHNLFSVLYINLIIFKIRNFIVLSVLAQILKKM